MYIFCQKQFSLMDFSFSRQILSQFIRLYFVCFHCLVFRFVRNKSLKTLRLSSYGFLGFILISIGNLKYLRTLNLSNCGFSRSISALVENLTNFSHNQLGIIPSHLNGFQVYPLSTQGITCSTDNTILVVNGFSSHSCCFIRIFYFWLTWCVSSSYA